MNSLLSRRAGAISATSVLAAILVFAAASPAQADDGITFAPPTQSLEYGQNWSVSGAITPQTSLDNVYGPLVVTTGSTTENLGRSRLYQGKFDIGDGDFNLALGVGTHAISATFTGAVAPAASSTPAVVTITAAPLLATTTIAPDSENSNNAIITSHLTGKFIDQLPNCACEAQHGYLLPAGTWKLVVTDSKGETVFSKRLTQSANGLPSLVNYWQGVPSGKTFTAESTFAVSGSSASNFAMSSQTFSWTSSKLAVGGATSPSRRPHRSPITTTDVAPPVLFFWAILPIALILVAVDIVLVIRRPSRTHGHLLR